MAKSTRGYPRPRPGRECVSRPVATPAAGLVVSCLTAMHYAVIARRAGQRVAACAALPVPRIAIAITIGAPT